MQRVMGELAEELAQEVQRLASEHIDTLVIDVTANPGGSGTLAAMLARVVTMEPVGSEKAAVVKNSQSLWWLKRERARIMNARHSKDLAPAEHVWLGEGLRRSELLVKEFAGQPCDRRSWFAKPAQPACTRLTTGEYFGGGFFSEVPRDLRISPSLRNALFSARSRELVSEGVWGGPLVVLVGRNTCSAAELFSQALHEHGGALLLGERTRGCGGGWLFNQQFLTLPNSRMRVTAPDYVDFLKDGRNARVGLDPDICLERRSGATPVTRATGLLQTLKRVF